MHHDTLIFSVALIGALGLGAQWLAWRLQAPAIVLMALAGLLAGPFWTYAFGAPLLEPSAEFGDLLRPIIALAVAVILFEGGLVLTWRDLKEAGPVVSRLVFAGAPLAWVLGTLACHYAGGLDWGTSTVFAGVLVVTGPTVIMPLLRQSKLGGKVGAALRWEGIVNDPVGALFGVAAFEVLRVLSVGENALTAAAWIVIAAAFGAAIGIAMGFAISHAFRSGWAPEYLKAPIIFATVILVYALADLVEAETGLVAVTAYGMTMANSRLAGLVEMRRFKENIAVLLISGVFVILTANLTPEVIEAAMNWNTLAFLLAMLFVVRPLSVGLATLGTVTRKEAMLLGWIAPRGVVAVAVSGFFAERLVELDRQRREAARQAMEQSGTGGIFVYEPHFPGAEQIVPLAFAMVFATVVLHGFTIGPWSRLLGLARKRARPGVLIVGVNPWSIALAQTLRRAELGIIMADSNWRRLGPAREAGLETFWGEVLSEDAEVKLDHARFETALALSANEPYNALVASHFIPELGRHRVFQLAGQDGDEDDGASRGIGSEARGRTLIRRGRGYDPLIRDLYRGWSFSLTRLTPQYTLDSFRKERADADLIAEVRTTGGVNFLGPNREARGGEGTLIVSFGPPAPAVAGDQAAGATAAGGARLASSPKA